MAYPEPRSKEELKNIKDGATFYKELREENDRLRTLLIDILPEANKRPFICGSSGDEGIGVMPEFFLICPIYGADIRQTTKYIKETKDV